MLNFITKVKSRRKKKTVSRGVHKSNLIQINADEEQQGHVKFCKMSFLNPWSVCNKYIAIHDFITESKLDLLAVAESWMKSKETNKPERIYQHEMFPSTHEMICSPRPDDQRGGGIAIIYKKCFMVNIIGYSKADSGCQFEHLVVSVKYGKTMFRLIIVYRPDPTIKNGLKVPLFWPEFEKFLTKHVCSADELIITGDLNFHLDKPTNTYTRKFNLMVDEFGLKQKIIEPTHTAGHTLDILMAREESKLIHDFNVADPCLHNDEGKRIKDHFAIHWTLNMEKPKPTIKVLEYRKIKNIDMRAFLEDLSNTDLAKEVLNDPRTVEDLVNVYNSTFESLMDKHAPLVRRNIISRENTPWYNAAIKDSKRKRRQAERRWRQSQNVEHLEQYRKQCSATNKTLRETKLQFFSGQIAECGRDQKAIFKLTNSWMGTTSCNSFAN